MKAVLHYQRLNKPRGGWRYPLALRFGIEAPEEMAFYASWEFPAWSCQDSDRLAVAGGPRVAGERHINVRGLRCWRQDSRQTIMLHLDTDCPVIDTRLYFLTDALRSSFIQHMTDIVFPDLRQRVDSWLDENAEVPGDALPTELVYDPDTVAAAAASDMPSRRILVGGDSP